MSTLFRQRVGTRSYGRVETREGRPSGTGGSRVSFSAFGSKDVWSFVQGGRTFLQDLIGNSSRQHVFNCFRCTSTCLVPGDSVATNEGSRSLTHVLLNGMLCTQQSPSFGGNESTRYLFRISSYCSCRGITPPKKLTTISVHFDNE